MSAKRSPDQMRREQFRSWLLGVLRPYFAGPRESEYRSRTAYKFEAVCAPDLLAGQEDSLAHAKTRVLRILSDGNGDGNNTGAPWHQHEELLSVGFSLVTSPRMRESILLADDIRKAGT